MSLPGWVLEKIFGGTYLSMNSLKYPKIQFQHEKLFLRNMGNTDLEDLSVLYITAKKYCGI
jgi:hypothetical protein